MKKVLNHGIAAALFFIFSIGSGRQVFSMDQIIRPFQSVRSTGMGGVRITTGLYEENFFGNPARVTANPRFRVNVLDPTFEVSSTSIKTVGKLVGSQDLVADLTDTSGGNNHARFQMTLPSVYFPVKEDRKMAFAFGMLWSAQSDVSLRKSYQVNPQAYLDVGPSFTVGRKFLENDPLSVGLTTHLSYRLNSIESFSLGDVLKGLSMSPQDTGGEGAMFDFDVGGTYLLPWKPLEFDITTGLALTNVIGGGYGNVNMKLVGLNSLPRAQSRALGLGGSATKATWGKFSDTTFALEFTDIGGTNRNGSFFKTVHMGAETHYGVLALRTGLYQGYLCGGLGVGFRFFSVDISTYGEELTLNSGGMQDRRFALRLALQI